MRERPTSGKKRPQRAAEPPASVAAAGERPADLVETWVDDHGDYLFGYVLPRVPDRHTAEELVQETFLAALTAIKAFRAESSPRTWLVGLLRHKIADYYRRRSRESQAERLDESDPVIDSWFDRKGAWIKWPGPCEVDPAELHQRADFWTVFENCLRALPGRLGEAFTLRVMDERASDDVCKVLSITPTNLWVALHRARARLRACLEANWFESDNAGKG